MCFLFYLILTLAAVNLSTARLIETVPVSIPRVIQQKLPKKWSQSGVLLFPECKRTTWVDALKSANKSIEISAYKLSDPTIIGTLLQVKKERPFLTIDVLIQPYVFAHEKSNNIVSPIELLQKNGISVHKLSDRFNQSHYKMLIVDGTWGIVSTGNLDAESFDGDKSITAEPCRDFALTITNFEIVKEMQRIFRADIHDVRVIGKHPQLVWGPDAQRHVFLNMINSARQSIKIYQQDFQDVGIAQAVAGAARAGIKVEVIMMPFPFSKTEDKNIPNQEVIKKAGGQVYLHKKHYVHAKVLIIDAENEESQLMYVGSCNFYPSSLDQTRELGVLTSDSRQIKEVISAFEKDKNS